MNDKYLKIEKEPDTVVLSFIVIGTEAIKISEDIFKRAMMEPIKYKETRYGNMKAIMYKQVFNRGWQINFIQDCLYKIWKNEYFDKITYLRQSSKCIILMNKINF